MATIRSFQQAHDPSVCKTYYVEFGGRGALKAPRVIAALSPGALGLAPLLAVGSGTAKSARHWWCELRFIAPPGGPAVVRQRLGSVGVPDRVILRVEPTVRGGGVTLSKQLGLFGGEA